MTATIEGGGFGIFAGVAATIGQNMADRYSGGRGEHKRKLMETLHQVPLGPIQVAISGGAGVYQMNDLLMPKAGYMWSVRNLTAAGYTAGSVIAYKGGTVVGTSFIGTGLAQPFPFSAAATQTLGRGELLLDQGDPLVIVCTGITLSAGYPGVQIVGAADCFERWFLPEYLG